MKAAVAISCAFALVLGALGCSSSNTTAAGEADAQSATPLPSEQQSLLGTYEVELRSTRYSGGIGQRTRVDLVNQGGELAVFLQGGGYGIGFARAKIEEITEAQVTTSFEAYGRTTLFIIKRSAGGAPLSATLDSLDGDDREGTFSEDTTAPTLASSTPGLPWEVTSVRFSEGLLAKDVKLPPSGETAFTLLPIADTPWVGAIGLRRPLSTTWDSSTTSSAKIPLSDIVATDPSGNTLDAGRGYVEARTLPVGKAMKAYDFSKDVPAYPPQASRLVGDCDGAASCLRLSQGSKIALRIAAGSRVVRLRYALRAGQFEGTAPAAKIALTAFVAPGDGSETKETAPVDVTWTAVPSPTETRAFATPFVDLEIALPRFEAETGISLRFDGEPRAAATPTPTTPAPGPQVVKARHMIMLLKSAVAE